MYGAERVQIELSCYLRENGVDVGVGALEHAGAGQPAVLREASAQGLPTVAFPCSGALDPRLPLRLGHFMRAQHIDLLHTHNYKVDIYGYLATLGARTIPLATCHNWLTQGLKLRVFEALDKRVLLRFPHAVAVSEAISTELRRVGMPAHRCSRIDNGMKVDLLGGAAERRTARRTLGLADKDFVVATVGRMDRFKAHHLQLRMMARLRKEGIKVKLLLVGEGELERDLRGLCRELRLMDQVTFTGYLKDVRPALAAADLFLLSSISEGLPMVLLEAMGAGLPVISTSVGGIPEVLQDGRAGVLVPPRDPHALATALGRLVRTPKERATLGRAARRRYESNYSREIMGRRYLDLYRRLMADNLE